MPVTISVFDFLNYYPSYYPILSLNQVTRVYDRVPKEAEQPTWVQIGDMGLNAPPLQENGFDPGDKRLDFSAGWKFNL